MIAYNKTRTPPKDTRIFETEDGLKFWRGEELSISGYIQNFSRFSLITEDPSITMHRFGDASRDGIFYWYLFCYRGTRMGFQFETPNSKSSEPPDILQTEITDIGIDTHDPTQAFAKDCEGRLIQHHNNNRLTHVGYPEHAWDVCTAIHNRAQNGWRDKFPDEGTQLEMLAIWADFLAVLLTGEKSGTSKMVNSGVSGKKQTRQIFGFSKLLLEQIRRGDFVWGKTEKYKSSKPTMYSDYDVSVPEKKLYTPQEINRLPGIPTVSVNSRFDNKPRPKPAKESALWVGMKLSMFIPLAVLWILIFNPSFFEIVGVGSLLLILLFALAAIWRAK